MFDWAKYKTQEGAAKLHTLLDYDGNLPAYLNISDGKTADNKRPYYVPLRKSSVMVADRFYNDFSLLNIWDSKGVFFVVLHKENLQFKCIKENELPKDNHQHILIDEVVELTAATSKKKYSGKLRRLAVWDKKMNKPLKSLPIKCLGQQTRSVSYTRAGGK